MDVTGPQKLDIPSVILFFVNNVRIQPQLRNNPQYPSVTMLKTSQNRKIIYLQGKGEVSNQQNTGKEITIH